MYSLDTHATIRDFEAAGIERHHAEAIVAAIARAYEQVARKADIDALTADIGSVRADITTLRWIVGIQSAFILAIALRVFGLV